MCKSPAADVLELFLNSVFGAHNPLRTRGEVSAPCAVKCFTPEVAECGRQTTLKCDSLAPLVSPFVLA